MEKGLSTIELEGSGDDEYQINEIYTLQSNGSTLPMAKHEKYTNSGWQEITSDDEKVLYTPSLGWVTQTRNSKHTITYQNNVATITSSHSPGYKVAIIGAQTLSGDMHTKLGEHAYNPLTQGLYWYELTSDPFNGNSFASPDTLYTLTEQQQEASIVLRPWSVLYEKDLESALTDLSNEYYSPYSYNYPIDYRCNGTYQSARITDYAEGMNSGPAYNEEGATVSWEIVDMGGKKKFWIDCEDNDIAYIEHNGMVYKADIYPAGLTVTSGVFNSTATDKIKTHFSLSN